MAALAGLIIRAVMMSVLKVPATLLAKRRVDRLLTSNWHQLLLARQQRGAAATICAGFVVLAGVAMTFSSAMAVAEEYEDYR